MQSGNVAHEAAATGAGFVENVRRRFVGLENPVPLADGSRRAYVNFDNAATTPALRAVADRVRDALEWYGSVHRGTGYKSMVSSQSYDAARERIAKFVGADSSHHTVIITCSTTGAINKLARTVSRGGRERPLVIASLMEHHSNLLPWREHCRVEFAEVRSSDGGLDLDDLERKVRRHAGELRLVAISGASNVTGLMPPIGRIARLAHENGAELFVDGAQLVPHRKVEMGAPDDPQRIDYLAFSGHKMYAPFGAGALIGRSSAFGEGSPETVGGGAVKLVTPETVLWADAPAREEAGTPNMLGAVAIAAAIDVLDEIGMDRVAEHDAEIANRIADGLRDTPGVQLYGQPTPGDHDHIGVVSFTAEQLGHSLLAAALGHEYGVAVRHGCFCAHTYLMRLLEIDGDAVQTYMAQAERNDQSLFPGLVRASVGVYNTLAEVETFIEAVRALLRDGPRARYVMHAASGEYLPS